MVPTTDCDRVRRMGSRSRESSAAHSESVTDVASAALVTLLALQVGMWSYILDLDLKALILNILLIMVLVALLHQFHKRWGLGQAIPWATFLVWFNVLLLASSAAHMGWLGEDTSELYNYHVDVVQFPAGIGLSDGTYTMMALKDLEDGGIRSVALKIHSAHAVGHFLLVWLLTRIWGIENLYAIVLMNVFPVMLTALVVLLTCWQVLKIRSSVPALAFLIHPFSTVFVATIYKDPFVVLGSSLLVMGLLVLASGGRERTSGYAGPGALTCILLGGGTVLLMRFSFGLALLGFGACVVGICWAKGYVARRRVLRMAGALCLACVAIAGLFAELDVLDAALNTINKLYDPTAATVITDTGAYQMSDDSIGGRFLTGTLTSRVLTLPLQFGMHLISPFPPRLLDAKHLYLWVEEWYGLLNLSFLPFILLGVWRLLRQGTLTGKILPACLVVLMLPVLVQGGIAARHLYPTVPILCILAWIGFVSSGRRQRFLAFCGSGAAWAFAFLAYFSLKEML